MREYLFRAWLKDTQEMIEVKSIHLSTKKIMYGFSGRYYYGNTSCSFDDCELMQFTGLTDKNNKKVFEGDIVKVNGVATATVIYNETDACYAFDYGPEGKPLIVELVDEHSVEVIGNIYENPELIGG